MFRSKFWDVEDERVRDSLGIATHLAFAGAANEFCKENAPAFGITPREVEEEIKDPVI